MIVTICEELRQFESPNVFTLVLDRTDISSDTGKYVVFT